MYLLVDPGKAIGLWWLGLLKEPAGALNSGKLFLQTAVLLWLFFFINKNVVNEMRGSLESVPLQMPVVLAYFLLICLDPCDENRVATLLFSYSVFSCLL